MKKMIRFSLLFALVVLLLTGCDDWNELVDSASGSGDDDSISAEEVALVIEPKKDPEPEPEPSKETGLIKSLEQAEKAKTSEVPESSADAQTEEYETRFDHTTTGSSDGGKSLVLCSGQRMDFDKCTAGGVTIPYHGHDKGRVSYWNMREEPRGDIVCIKNGRSYRYKADRTMVYGNCR
jgi:hypothetical protein